MNNSNSQQEFDLLLQRYFEKTASEEEIKALFQKIQSAEYDSELSAFIAARWENYDMPNELVAIGDGREALLRILGDSKETETAPVRHMRFWRIGWVKYAAAVLLLAMGYYFFTTSKKENSTVTKVNKPVETDVAPGKSGAVLTLANGKQIILDTLNNGIIATQSGTQVVLKDGLLSYDAANKPQEEVVYNIISTPKGRTFQLALPDGSRVWLNAASSIKYPAVFTANERRVEMEGEAYFEVSPVQLRSGGKVPFKVMMPAGAEVEVLGTHFNINAYNNETSIKTTLLEGKVKVVKRETANGKWDAEFAAVLKPGEQAVIARRSPLTIHHSPDLDQIIAWKNGLFNFGGMPLKEILNQLERWYNIEVVYEAPLKDIDFYGKIDRNANLSSIVKALNASGINCRHENRKLIMLP